MRKPKQERSSALFPKVRRVKVILNRILTCILIFSFLTVPTAPVHAGLWDACLRSVRPARVISTERLDQIREEILTELRSGGNVPLETDGLPEFIPAWFLAQGDSRKSDLVRVTDALSEESGEKYEAINQLFQKYLSGKKPGDEKALELATELFLVANAPPRSLRQISSQVLENPAKRLIKNLVLEEVAGGDLVSAFTRLGYLRDSSDISRFRVIAQKAKPLISWLYTIALEVTAYEMKMGFLPPGSFVAPKAFYELVGLGLGRTKKNLPSELSEAYRRMGNFDSAWREYQTRFPEEAARLGRVAWTERTLQMAMAVASILVTGVFLKILYDEFVGQKSMKKVMAVPRSKLIDTAPPTDLDQRRRDYFNSWKEANEILTGHDYDEKNPHDSEALRKRWNEIEHLPDSLFIVR